MIYVLTYCIFMSSSGESCDDVKSYPTMAACQEALNHHVPHGSMDSYKCEARKSELRPALPLLPLSEKIK